MFLIGGTCYSGTTLLTHLLNQEGVVCLDEPDFHNPEQAHRGIPVLQRLFPAVRFPPAPTTALSKKDSVDLMQECQHFLPNILLGMKTCNWSYVEYQREFQCRGFPVILLVRDIRDVLCRQLPSYLNEEKLNSAFRTVWNTRQHCSLLLRYEDLVADPDASLEKIAAILERTLLPKKHWKEDETLPHYYKNARHDLIKSGRVSTERVGIHKTSDVRISPLSVETAYMMGYE